jgi:hypothetical protein
MSIRRWNEDTRRYEPFSAGERKYPALPHAVRTQLERVLPTKDASMAYRPCRLTLKDGKKQDYVYVADAANYIKMWGVWPDQDQGKREIQIGDVEAIEESPSRLPPTLAQQLYDAGESGMGYVAFIPSIFGAYMRIPEEASNRVPVTDWGPNRGAQTGVRLCSL